MLAVEASTLPVPELLGHAVHAAAPVAALNEWAKHAVKGPPSGPVCPAFATQPVLVAVPVAFPVPEFSGQVVQLALPIVVL